MRAFAELIRELDATTSSSAKVKALREFLEQASDKDKLWCIALLTGKRPKRVVKASELRVWAAELAGIPDWLFEESYHVVGDLAETVSLLVPGEGTTDEKDLSPWLNELIDLAKAEDFQRKEYVTTAWMSLDRISRFAFTKLITGGFRIGVSSKNMVKALASYLERDENELAHRLMGNWTPQTLSFEDLLLSQKEGVSLSRPYPFYLAYPLEQEPNTLGPVQDWIIEHKWDGIRGQLIRRQGQVFIWSRGEELVTDRFPELVQLAASLPDGTALDGEILCHDGSRPLPFRLLQTRIGRKNVSAKTLKEAPVAFIAYDILERNEQDIRNRELIHRRQELESLVAESGHPALLLSDRLQASSWEEVIHLRETAREYKAEGLMLKRATSEYKVGRKRGDWWKWKVDPLSIDAVLIYAMRGHGRRANLFSDYTFAVWKGEELVPFTKAYSGLTDAEMREVDAFVKRNTLERFGPVRSVTPELVFEIGFEGIAASARHKSGVALRFPRMIRWRKDKPATEANTLEDLLSLLAQADQSNPL